MKTQVIVLLLLAVAGSAMAQHPQGNKKQEAPGAADFVAKLDKDGDGKVSAKEFDGPAEHFSRFDKDGDGYISESEAPKGPPPRKQGKERVKESSRPQRGQGESTPGFVTRLDKDGDGKVSKDEFDGPADAFSQLDKNSDGFLSGDEAPAGPPPGDRKQ